MKQVLYSCAIALLILLPSVSSGQIIFDTNNQTSFQLEESDADHLAFKNTISGIKTLNIKTKQGFFTDLIVPGYGSMTEDGNPKLPVLKKLIEIPYNSEFEINLQIISSKTISLSDYKIQNPIIPAQPPVSKSIDDPEMLEFLYNDITYETSAFFGQESVRVVDLGILRGVRMARLEVAPVQYNPVTGEISVISDMEVEINFKGANHFMTDQEKTRVFSPWFQANFGQLINYKHPQGRDLIEYAPVTYIIVSDPMFQTDLQAFINWKTKKGFQVVEAYTNDPAVGTTTTSIKNYLQNFYNSPPAGFNPQSFVLIVGDVAQVPTFNGNAGSHVTDLYYCEYTGDLFPEVYYGRFSATNLTQLQPQIDKTLEYEQYLMPDPTFLDEVVMVAGHDNSHQLTWGNGQINYGTQYYFNAAHGLFSHTYLQPEPSGANYSGQIRQNVSDGVAYANYSAHCSTSGWADPSFSTSHISALTNAHKYPLMVGNCCSSLEFQTNCFGEEILRAANKGAVGYIGGSNSTYWDEDFWWGVGFEAIAANPVYNSDHLGAYDRTFHDGTGLNTDDWFVTQGQMPSAGNLAVTQSGTSREAYYWEIYHLMGDPSLMIYFSQPPDISVNYAGLMPLSSESFTINTEPYAYVAISKNGILHGAALADENGIAEVLLDPINEPGLADVVATKQNGKPFMGTVQVAAPNGPYIQFESLSIDDENGNNNGLADYGEQIFLDVSLNNLGSEICQNTHASLTCNDQYVQLINANYNWPDIPAGEVSLVSHAFEILIASDIPDQHTIEFTLEIGNGVNTWNSEFSIEAQAPEISLGEFLIDDSADGDGNGRLDAGETANLIIPVSNTGHSSIFDVESILTSTSSWIEIANNQIQIGTLDPTESTEASFSVTLDEETPIGTTISFLMEAGAGGYHHNIEFVCIAGIIVEDFETASFSTFNWQFDGDENWTIDPLNSYDGSYSAKSGNIGDYETSEIFVQLEVLSNGEISFAGKVSSEPEYDFLVFYIDDVEMGKWSGTVSWTVFSFDVTAGRHTFKWVYEKDSSQSSGSDCAWIDQIILPPINTNAILEVTHMDLDDSSAGNGNNLLDPGETVEASIYCNNIGIGSASNVTGVLLSNSEFLTFSTTEFTWEEVVANSIFKAEFTITVSPDAPADIIANLSLAVHVGNISTQKTFYLPIGFSNLETFETGDFSQFNWQFSGNTDWATQAANAHNGQYCARSGVITHNQQSGLSINMDVAFDGMISFWFMLDSEVSYDYFQFFIDDIEVGKWSGSLPWQYIEYPVEQGDHTFKWLYDKDGSISASGDYVLIDDIGLPFEIAPTTPIADFMALNTQIQAGDQVQFYDLSSGFPDQYSWAFEGGTPATSQEQNPTVNYLQSGNYDVTLEVSNSSGSDALTFNNYITVGGDPVSQTLTIPAGWSGLSTCLIPENSGLNSLFQPIMDDLIILQSGSGIFHPELEINTLGPWDHQKGYKIKLENEVQLTIQGWDDPDREIELQQGWNLIPVLSTCDASTDQLFETMINHIVVVKEVAGSGVFWPLLNINTIGYLRSGKAYFILVDEDVVIGFEECE